MISFLYNTKEHYLIWSKSSVIKSIKKKDTAKHRFVGSGLVSIEVSNNLMGTVCKLIHET